MRRCFSVRTHRPHASHVSHPHHRCCQPATLTAHAIRPSKVDLHPPSRAASWSRQYCMGENHDLLLEKKGSLQEKLFDRAETILVEVKRLRRRKAVDEEQEELPVELEEGSTCPAEVTDNYQPVMV